jgi:organic radical activating enzyme
MIEAKQLIRAFPIEKRKRPEHENYLRVSEFFYDSIQGEGINLGHPSAFLRLQGCSLDCVWCDTTEVWKQGNPYTFDELFSMMADSLIIPSLKNGQHLVLTGGSPLLQQDHLVEFLYQFQKRFHFKPYTEIENECSLFPTSVMSQYIDCWNNSPKLDSSGNPFQKRYNPLIIVDAASYRNSWFKFVITKPEDWHEIDSMFLKTRYIDRSQVILMPEGATKAEVDANTEMVVQLAIREGVLFRTREHIVLWDKKIGI